MPSALIVYWTQPCWKQKNQIMACEYWLIISSETPLLDSFGHVQRIGRGATLANLLHVIAAHWQSG